MGVLAWVIAPALKDSFSGAGNVPMFKALLLLLTAGMAWQFVLVALLVWHEQRTLRWSRSACEALWLRSPRSPNTGRVGGKLWLILILLVLLFAVEAVLPTFTLAPENRDFATFVDSAVGKSFFSGAWGWFGVVILMQLFNTVLGEELLFRGPPPAAHEPRLRPRRLAANGVLFTAYHVHVPDDAGHAAHRYVRKCLPGEAVPERLDRDRRPRRPERVLRGAPSRWFFEVLISERRADSCSPSRKQRPSSCPRGEWPSPESPRHPETHGSNSVYRRLRDRDMTSSP